MRLMGILFPIRRSLSSFCVLTQTRLNLPAWLGVGDALAAVASTKEGVENLSTMYATWPFFKTNIGTLLLLLLLPVA